MTEASLGRLGYRFADAALALPLCRFCLVPHRCIMLQDKLLTGPALITQDNIDVVLKGVELGVR